MSINLSEPETELKPIDNPDDQPGEGVGLNDEKPHNKVPDPGCPATKITFWDKVWDGTKHVLYGAGIAGGALLAVKMGWLSIPEAVAAFAVIEGGRKVAKDTLKNNGKDYADVLDKLLMLILELVKLWRENKSKKK
jgi:hypothetical protein